MAKLKKLELLVLANTDVSDTSALDALPKLRIRFGEDTEEDADAVSAAAGGSRRGRAQPGLLVCKLSYVDWAKFRQLLCGLLCTVLP